MRSIFFIPGGWRRFCASRSRSFATTPLRETLDRQTGMYRVAAKITDDQSEDARRKFLPLRRRMPAHDSSGNATASGAIASTRLPSEKFDPASTKPDAASRCIPLLCQEACNLLVAEAREVVKARADDSFVRASSCRWRASRSEDGAVAIAGNQIADVGRFDGGKGRVTPAKSSISASKSCCRV